ncbi:histone-lysine N-methyltransferase, H3 lysine-79 specific isoform X2 [Esox lucius]|uniref:histone-lysine N-methyltransferase, H3 lysine-79 specific isoform X2 n=1 Tax=Esox lucius TaxID=8010 RepID=UPI001477537F|nr:histone-lysine N-methyltransferase, H3 lysine-79 specific isoform X2 [Esox lucius]
MEVFIVLACLLRAASTIPTEQIAPSDTLDQLPLQQQMVPQINVVDQIIPTQVIPQVSKDTSPIDQVLERPQLLGNQTEQIAQSNTLDQLPLQQQMVPQINVVDQILPSQVIPQTQSTSSSESQSSDQSHSKSSPENTSEDTASEEPDHSEDTTSEEILNQIQNQAQPLHNSSSSSSSSSSSISSISSESTESDSLMRLDQTGLNMETQDDSRGSHENRRRNPLSAFHIYLKRSHLPVVGGATGALGGGTGEAGGEKGGAVGETAGGLVRAETLAPPTVCRGDTGCLSNELMSELGDDHPGNQHGKHGFMWPNQEEREMTLDLKR